MKNKNIIVLVGIILAFCLGITVVIIFARLNYKNPATVWSSYQSKKYNYEIKYPANWRFDDSQQRLPYDAIFAPNNKVVITVGVLALGQRETADNVIKEIKTQFEKDKNYSLRQFEGLLGELPGFRAVGYFEEGKTNYQFEEWGIINNDGRMFNLRAQTEARDQSTYSVVLKFIFESFSFLRGDGIIMRPIWEQRILSRISNLPEVKEFRQLVGENNKSTFNVRVAAYPTQDLPYYLIQVYEIFSDHQTTFGWYRYNPATDDLSQENF